LGLLMIGVVIVQIPLADTATLTPLKDAQSSFSFPRSLDDIRNIRGSIVYRRSATYEGIQEDLMLEHPQMNAPLGLAAALSACMISAAASVYFEKVLKESNTPASLWTRNVQLSFYSLFPALFIGVVFVDGESMAKAGFFSGYNWIVWTTISFQAVGGILVALCVNYADNIAKNFATSISISLSLIASVWFFHFKVTGNFLVGTTIVILATYLYNSQDQPQPPPIRIHNYEKTTIDGGVNRTGDLSLKLPNGPVKSDSLATSRPSSPSGFSRLGASKGYFASKHREE